MSNINLPRNFVRGVFITHLMELFAKIINGFQPIEEVKRIGSSKLAVNK